MGAVDKTLNTKVGGTATQVFDPGGMTGGTVGGFLNPLGDNGGILGLPGAAPKMADIQQGTTVGDVQGAQSKVGNSLQSQQALLAALQGQNGLQQQNSVAGQQQALANQLGAANGIGVQQGAIQGLQGAAGMYGDIAQGRGPNPAMAALNQATGQNVANQAALMAGQRGAGSNVGMLARQAGQQGAGLQQQAVGQGATMQAQQQLNALSGLTGAQQAIGGLGTSQLGAQQAQQQALANQANTVAGQQIAGTTANTQANLANQQQLQGALQGINTSNVASQGSVNAANAALAQANAGAKQGIIGGMMNGLGSMFAAEGGEVKKAGGGNVDEVAAPVAAPQMGASSSFGKFLNDWGGDAPAAVLPEAEPIDLSANKKEKSGSGGLIKGIASIAALAAAEGGLATSGGHVKPKSSSQKAIKKGDSYDNDKVPAMLSAGEIVIPRSVSMGKDPIKGAADFVAKVLAKRSKK